MERSDVERWFRDNPAASRVDLDELLDRCERAVRRHAEEDAWLAAKRYALARAREWQSEWSPPASEQFVTREVCHGLSWELAHHEPQVEPGAEEHLAGGPVKEVLSPEGWEVIRRWVIDLARSEEHRVWTEVVRFTDRRAEEIIEREHFTRDAAWDADHRYSAIAAHVAEILAHDYSLRAHPR